MKISSGIKPQAELLLFLSFSLSVYISVKGVRIAAEVAQELEIYLVVVRSIRTQLQHMKLSSNRSVTRIYLCNRMLNYKSVETTTDIKSGDSSGGVSGDKLQLHVDLSEQELLLGLKSGAGRVIKRESEKIAVVEDFTAAIAPSNVEVLQIITA